MLRGAGAPQCGGCGGPGSRRGVEAGRDGGGADHGGRGVVEGSQAHSHLCVLDRSGGSQGSKVVLGTVYRTVLVRTL